jgi:hypothetical protein
VSSMHCYELQAVSGMQATDTGWSSGGASAR